ncbi:MAG: hypothetical protein Fur005_21680 [Roseiflexaceae bacterium]
MLETTLAPWIAQIHGSGHKTVIEFAGAGSLGLFWLHAVAGSSRTILEATDRYAPASMTTLLGQAPARFVARETAEAMAERAYRRAMTLSDGDPNCLGVACTATIATDRIKKGDHGCWIAVRDSRRSAAYGLVIAKGLRDRLGEEALVSRLLIWALAKACDLGELPLDLAEGEQLDQEVQPADDPFARLLAGEVMTVTITPDGEALADTPFQGGLLSGSYNPLHAGHEQLAHASSVALHAPVAFELPILNADKPPLGYAELERRIAQFRGRHTVVLSRAPRFVDKATLYPGCTFILGYDTAVRLLDPRYYRGLEGLRAALAEIGSHGCRILVAGRERDGVFRTLADLSIPTGFEGLFQGLSERVFRSDLSSTAIRAQLAG